MTTIAAMARHKHFLFLTGLALGGADRPEIKNDADETIVSNSTATGLSMVESGGPPIWSETTPAYWATCDSGVETANHANTMIWLTDAQATDATFHGFGLNMHADSSTALVTALAKFCTSKLMDIVFKTNNDPPHDNHVAMHTKYFVPKEEEDTFLEHTETMLKTKHRRGGNYLRAESNLARPFEYGYLMILDTDNDKEYTASGKYWHILQFFGDAVERPIDPPKVEPDSYDTFVAHRNNAMRHGKQWIRFSNLINQKSISLTFSIETPKGVRADSSRSANDMVQWLSCSHPPARDVRTVTDFTEHHFLEDNPFDLFLQTHHRRPNYHILQFAKAHGEMNVYKNCRVQKLVMIRESGDFELDTDDVVMHMEYEILADKVSTAYFENAAVALMNSGEEEFKYMAIMRSHGKWNGKYFYHVYQTFQTQETFKAHQVTGCGDFITKRNSAYETTQKAPWIKVDPYVDGSSPVLIPVETQSLSAL